MITLKEYLDEQINEQLKQIVISGRRDFAMPENIRIRPVLIKGEVCYQCSAQQGTKALHHNYSKKELIAYLESILDKYGQLQAVGAVLDGTVLISRKGKMTIKTKRHAAAAPAPMKAHNRVKQYILKEGIPVSFLVDLGVMNRDGKVLSQRYDKFRQINRFLEFIEDVVDKLPDNREITILDFGCGKSYLTFAIYYYFCELKQRDVRIIGLDLKEDVIVKCNALAAKYGYEKLHFCQGDIAQFEGVSAVDMVVTLHACDTATDYALAKAVEWGAQVILSVPCCQHEMNRQIKSEILQPVLKYGILKERMSALITDGVRANLLEEKGYDTQILEFIDMEHTPKNLLIRAVKSGKRNQNRNLEEMMKALHAVPTLEKLLYPRGREWMQEDE
ncbi:MAG: SAM-dependent methyltransferase [Blautia sp.]|nr:SAM-dependent methyltransferase [Blautia sp.]